MTDFGHVQQPIPPQRITPRSDGDAHETPGRDARVGRRRDDRWIAASAASQRVLEQALAAARAELPVLISGPPGSGRTLVAHAIRGWSRRASAPLETVLCAGIPEPLQARELFGCAAGTFPALPEAHLGALERAGEGTLVLEGIEALGPGPRALLTRALTEGRYRPEGEGAERSVRVRLIAIASAPEAARLFADRPHQEIRLQPLAERPEDVLPLAAHFLASLARELGQRPIGFTPGARAALLEEPWSGNAAELRERIRNALQLCQDGAVSAEALALAADDAEQVPSFREAKRAFETRYVVGLLRRCQGNISRAARLARKDRKDFYDVIRRTGVDPSAFRS